MTLRTTGVSEDHEDLAALAREFAQAASQSDTDPRNEQARYTAGELPASWPSLVETGLHSVHIPEVYDGGGAGLLELAVVLEQLAAELYPGPILSTVTASALLVEMALSVQTEHEGIGTALRALVRGSTAAVVVDPGVTASRSGDAICVHGEATRVSGAQAAEAFLVSFDLDGETRWAFITAEDAEVTGAPSLDLTRDLGTVTIDAEISTEDLLPALDRRHAIDLRLVLEGAEASGVASTVTDKAVEHAKMRTQFRRPLSAFQAIQQRLSLMYVHSEIARAVVWDMARCNPAQRAIAARAGAISALSGALDNAFEYVMTLGAMGFTWEHNAHLYWRRAIQLGVLEGPRATMEYEQGLLALDHRIEVAVATDEDLPELRADVARALDAAGDPGDGVIPGSAWAPRRDSAWQRSLARERLVAPHLPEPYGRSADALAQAVILDEFSRRGVSPPSLIIGDWVAPTIAEHGTQEQKDRFLPPTLESDVIWCQLFSEPGAGSDLGSISSRARRVEGGWKVTGQKIWNSLADVADWGALLVRTDPDSTGSRGLSFMIVGMDSEGIEVRPIKQATGLSEFCEVFLDDVFVPDEHLIGEAHQGWAIATTTLSNERLRMGEELGHGASSRFRELIDELPDGSPLRYEATSALGRAVSREYGLQALGARGAIKRISGLDVSSETSVLKLANIMAQRDGTADLLRLSGPDAIIDEQISIGDDNGSLMDYLGLPAVVIGGGTPDIQLGVIAGRVLGLR